MTRSEDIPALLDALCEIYDASVSCLRSALAHYLERGERPDPKARTDGLFAYPELRIDYRHDEPGDFPTRAYGRLNRPGRYATSIARPRLFRRYLEEQLRLLVEDYAVEVSVGRSESEIPYPYVLDGSEDLRLDGALAADLGRWFPTTELAHIGDEIADGAWLHTGRESRPLALFDGPRVDFSLARLRHYSGTPSEHTQRYILFTNYIRYVDEFVRFAVAELQREDSPYEALSAAGGVYVTSDTEDAEAKVAEGGWRRHQMPAYHLIAPGGGGITLVNIGVGPSNAKTVCDHLAVLRPEAWLMIGHCGGLRPSQTIGDYVLAHAYLRDDHVLDDVLPTEIPLPAIAEVQQALFDAAAQVTGRGAAGAEETPAHRHGRHHRRPQLGIALHGVGDPLQPVARRRHRHGIGDGGGAGLSLPRALRHPALRLGQAAPRRDQAARPGQCLLRARDQPASPHRHRDASHPQAGGRPAPFAQAAQLRRAALPVSGRHPLVECARQAALGAYAPYSGFAVGCAIESVNGEVAAGANMENACYRLGVCAEIAALTAAQQAFGLDKIARIAVSGGRVEGGALAGASVVTSCGGCRQSILEAAQLSGCDIEIVSANGDGSETRVDRISTLLPHGFGPANLRDAE